MPPGRIVVVGASVGAVAFAQRYRGRGGEGEVVLVGAEPQLPYDRPPLSKQALLSERWDPAEVRLLDEDWYTANAVELRLGRRAVELEPDRLRVALDDGDRLDATEVVIATGSRPRMLAGSEPSASVFYLRDLDDALRLRERLPGGGRMIVIGAGFIGLEVAAAAIARDWETTVLEREASPLVRVLGAELGRLCARGYDVRCGWTGGPVVTADAIVVGVGARPNVEWLDGSGVRVDNGVVCDTVGRTSRPHVWAVGDVARWPNLLTGRHDRVEQWKAARDQGAVVADALLGAPMRRQHRGPDRHLLPEGPPAGWTAPPYFWADLLGGTVQMLGHCDPAAPAHVARDGRRAVAVVGRERLEGVLAISVPRAVGVGRRLLAAGTTMPEARAWADTVLAAP